MLVSDSIPTQSTWIAVCLSENALIAFMGSYATWRKDS